MFFKVAVICSIICLATATGCTKLLGELANNQTQLLYCITTSSVPVTMCINCYDKYREVLKSYDLLAAQCSNVYFDKDRINLVASMESALTGLWSKAYCDDCFNNNNSLIFNDKNSNLDGCLIIYKSEPCEKCKKQYLELNNFYINLDQHNNGEVCFDLQDSMNRTRNKWSKELKCCRREQNMTLFAVALGITFFLPLLFYGTTYLITKHREDNHGVLNDEDPLHNSSLPSTSGRSNLNNINNPMQSLIDSRPSSSNVSSPSVTISSKPVQHKKGFNILNEDLESSDDDIHVNAVVDSKEKLK